MSRKKAVKEKEKIRDTLQHEGTNVQQHETQPRSWETYKVKARKRVSERRNQTMGSNSKRIWWPLKGDTRFAATFLDRELSLFLGNIMVKGEKFYIENWRNEVSWLILLVYSVYDVQFGVFISCCVCSGPSLVVYSAYICKLLTVI